MRWWLYPDMTEKMLTRIFRQFMISVEFTVSISIAMTSLLKILAYQLSCHMGKPTICIGENKGQISFAVTAKLISAFVFTTRIVQFLFYLKQKFQASSSLLCLYKWVCVGPVGKPHCWFSHETAHILRSARHFTKC